MSVKWVLFSLTTLYLAQVQGAPQVLSTLRDLEADVAAAEGTTLALIADTNEMIFEEAAFSNLLSTEVSAVLRSVINNLADFGIPQSLLDQLWVEISASDARARITVTENISYLTELLGMLEMILADLSSNLNQLFNDSWAIYGQRNKINYYLFNARVYINNEFKGIESSVAELTVGLTPEEAAGIEAKMATARGLMTSQFEVVSGVKAKVDLGISVLIRQIEDIGIQLPPPEQLARGEKTVA